MNSYRMFGWLSVFFLLWGQAGCALQADLVDTRVELDRVKAQEQKSQERLKVIEDYFKERAISVQQGQADLGVRMDQISSNMQILQGRMEENNHQISNLGQRMDDLSAAQRELTGRVEVLESRLAVVSVPQGSVTPGAQPIPTPTPGGYVIPGRTIERPGDKASSLSPAEAYNLAYNDYVKGNYDLSIAGFRNFMKQNPSSILAADAHYWLAESLYSKKDYKSAAEEFAAFRQSFPKSEKVPAAFLKEGYALAESGDRTKAVSTLKQVIERYPYSDEANLAKEKLADLR